MALDSEDLWSSVKEKKNLVMSVKKDRSNQEKSALSIAAEHDVFIFTVFESFMQRMCTNGNPVQARADCFHEGSLTSICSLTSALDPQRLEECYLDEQDKCALRALQRITATVEDTRGAVCT